MEIKTDKNDAYRYVDNHGCDKIIYGLLSGKFEVGDKVQVIGIGQLYSSYKEMAHAMKIPEDKWSKHQLHTGYIGNVIARKVHCCGSDILYGVQFNTIHIIGESGLKLVEKKGYIEQFNDKDFEL